ncbi:MAG TPA: hypothetical protein VKN18_26180 [Blastocatellia bacterium]|nr:hypothetical protein [Blastocatellia bacterium]
MNFLAAYLRNRLARALSVIVVVLAVATTAFSGNELAGRWTLTINFPDGPNSTTTRTQTVTLEVFPRGDSLHGRANLTDESGKKYGATWRQVGKRVSIAYELPCSGDTQCASMILQGRVKGGGILIKKGSVIVVWDTPNNRNPALFDTANGTFRGDRIE